MKIAQNYAQVYPYFCLTLSSTPKCVFFCFVLFCLFFFFFAELQFLTGKIKIKMADRKNVLSKVVKILFFITKQY